MFDGQNLRVTNSAIRESPCGVNTTFRNNTLVNSAQNICRVKGITRR